ncbi:Gfo/Idh/MocA family protein [Oceaniglobus trochenteri]|uniref:Gfo/Idh/MocA family protein n=1 Tax=Oceaniglobus trochenteri TaxID=2763260 RepID=UPI001CFF7420|nr:Gfo/Idh/MocA family oxidoreductase [Oceaniglobus trochenteri]
MTATETPAPRTRLLILGTGSMAHTHATAFSALPGVEIVAAVDVSPGRLAAFCEKFDIAHRFATLDEALAWGAFDAASNVTPDQAHHATTMPLIAAGKHVLCEKPLATSYTEAAEMRDAAQAAGVVNMVNLTYRNNAAMQHAARMVAEGKIGEVRHFEASYLQSWLVQPAWGEWSEQDQWLWRLSRAHGSAGVLGDVGIHILDFATHVAGGDVASVSCRLKTFDKAEGGQIGPYVLDANDSCAMHVELTNGAIGVVHASRFATGHLNDLTLRIHGTKGALLVESANHTDRLSACLAPQSAPTAWESIPLAPVQTVFAAFISAIRDGAPQEPDFARGAALQKVLDDAGGRGLFRGYQE